MPRLRTRRATGVRLQGTGTVGARRDRQAYGHDPGPLPRVGHHRGRDGISPRSAADPRSGETDVTGQCRRAAGVDPGRPGHSPYSGGRGLARLHRRDLFLITRAVRARPHPSPRSLPRDRVIQRDTVYSGRILQRPDFWDRVPGSGVADGWCPMPATFPRGGRGAVAAPARAPLVAHAPTPPGIPPTLGCTTRLHHPRAYFAWSAFTFSASVMNSSGLVILLYELQSRTGAGGSEKGSRRAMPVR